MKFYKEIGPKMVGLYRIPPKMVIERRFQDIHSNFLEIVVNKKGIKFGSDFFSWNYTFETPIKAVRSGYKVQWVDFISEVAFQGYDCASLFSPKNSFQIRPAKIENFKTDKFSD